MPPRSPMFETLRQSLRDLMDRATPPEVRRAGLARMKETLVTARLGLEDVRGAVAITRGRLAREEQELATMRRRGALAAGIDDAETVALAARYASHHEERVALLRRKLEAQEAELAMAERDVGDMTAELRDAMAGLPGRTAGEPATHPGAGGRAEHADRDRDAVASEIDALARARARGARDADADARLADLKRRMGK